MPDTRALLIGVFAFRSLLALLLLLQGAVGWTSAPDAAFVAAVAVLITLVVTGHGVFRYVVRRDAARTATVLVQALVDLALVTGVVHFGGERAPALAALYVVVIALYAVLLPVAGGVAVAVLASAAYLADVLLASAGELPPGLLGQIAVFGFVFLLIAALGYRLRDTAARQTRLETELEQVRFEAGEILRSIRAGVLTVDGQGRLAFLNPPAARLLDLGQHPLGEPVLELLAERAPELHEAIAAGIRSGVRVGRGEGTVRRPNGGSFPVGLSTATFQREGIGGTAVTAVFTDLSELKQLQELQLRAERLEAVASLSASLAHEIRNPLASIRSSVEQLAHRAVADEDERVLGNLIIRESDRLSRLLGEFLDFSRVRAVHFAPVDLAAVAREAIHLVREHPDCGEALTVGFEGEPTLVEADEDLLHRIVSNLVLNAVQACGGHGVVRVRVGPAPAAELPPGAGIEEPVRLVVEDDGPGIDPDLRERLFQPFVSGRAGGSGLGLAIVHRAVEAHRGLVLLDSAPGEGARFTVYLRSRLYREDAA